MDEILYGIRDAVCKNPHKAGRETKNKEVFAIPTEPHPGAPALVAYYSIEESDVTLLSIRIADPDTIEDDGE